MAAEVNGSDEAGQRITSRKSRFSETITLKMHGKKT